MNEAEKLRAARDAAGLTLDEAAALARRVIGIRRGLSSEQVRRYETGDLGPDAAMYNPLHVIALFDVYQEHGVRTAPSPETITRLDSVNALIERQVHRRPGRKVTATRGKHRPSARQIVSTEDRELVGAA